MENYTNANTYEIVHCDTCLPDYWSGHHLAHFSILVDGSTTFKEVRDSLTYELMEGAISGSVDIEVLESERFFKKTQAAINRLKPFKKHSKIAFPDLPKNTECAMYEDQVCAFFVIVAR